MPPLRTLPPAKPVKTERTHEENQERAYIAASRRSDRSLEARVESARRASEIHKRRTGRSLRVTEDDVINEEMYEEEDDDLPAQIRRITAHLHTGNDPFNRRLQAYLANHIALRSALGQAVADNWQQQHMQNNTLGQYLSPGIMQQQQHDQLFASKNPMLPPHPITNWPPHSYRQSPYPSANGTPNPAAMTPGLHARSASIASPHELGNHQMSPHPTSALTGPTDARIKHEDRRYSLPAHSQTQQPTQPGQHSGDRTSPAISRDSSSSNVAAQQTWPHCVKQSPRQQPTPLGGVHGPFTEASQSPFPTSFGPAPDFNFHPFSATLPLDAQQLLAGAPASDLNHPAMAAMMQSPFPHTPSGEHNPAPGFYSYNPNGSKPKSASPPSSIRPSNGLGMNSTLAPSALDTTFGSGYSNNTKSASSHTDNIVSPFTPASGLGFGFDAGLNNDSFKDFALLSSDSNGSTGHVTPGEADWNMWLDNQALTEETGSG